MSTADDPDDEKTLSGPPGAGAARQTGGDDPESGIHAERRRGRAAAALQPGHTLPLGTRLRDYEITGLIGEGGFGIVYLAWDHSLQRRVAIKEYMPASMAARVNGSSAIVVKSERHLDTFRAGLKSFVNEARLLARFDHPSLVKVYRFWEENGTAYMVMPYYEGPTLKAALAELGRAPTEAELRAWLNPLLDALAVMHAAQCYHRDISPDNILLTPRGPLLLDFGAARRVIGDMTHAITVVLKPGYAPIEQYGDVATMAQGAWTDLYALACVVYYAIAGKTPTSSVERLMDDRVEPLAVAAAGRYSDAFLRAIDAALAVRPGDRPQTEREFRALLDAGLPAQTADDERESAFASYATRPGALTPASTRPFASTEARTVVATPNAALTASESLAADELRTTAMELPATIERDPSIERVPSREQRPNATTPISPATSPSHNSAATLLIGAAILAVIATVALFAWLQQRGTAPSSAAAPSAIAAPASFAAPSPPTGAASTPSETTAAELPRPIAPPAPSPTVAEKPTGAAPLDPPAPAVGEGTANEAPTRNDGRSDSAPEAAKVPQTTAAPERATIDGDAASGIAAAPPRTPRPRRDAPRTDSAAVAKPAPPRTPSISATCSDILQKASLEPLTAAEAAYLKRECR